MIHSTRLIKCKYLNLFLESTIATIVEKADKDLNTDMNKRVIGGINLMAHASQSVFEWCHSVKPLLKASSGKQPTQDSHLMLVLDDGNGKMNLAEIELRMGLLIFNAVTVKLILLQNRFENEIQKENEQIQTDVNQNIIADFKEKLTSTEEFYKNLKAKANEMFLDISELKAIINEIKNNVTTDVNSSHDDKLTENLIAKCNEITNE